MSSKYENGSPMIKSVMQCSTGLEPIFSGKEVG